MAHFLPCGCLASDDKCRDRLGAMPRSIGRDRIFVAASNLAEIDDGLRFRVGVEQFQRLRRGQALDCIAADATPRWATLRT